MNNTSLKELRDIVRQTLREGWGEVYDADKVAMEVERFLDTVDVEEYGNATLDSILDDAEAAGYIDADVVRQSNEEAMRAAGDAVEYMLKKAGVDWNPLAPGPRPPGRDGPSPDTLKGVFRKTGVRRAPPGQIAPGALPAGGGPPDDIYIVDAVQFVRENGPQVDLSTFQGVLEVIDLALDALQVWGDIDEEEAQWLIDELSQDPEDWDPITHRWVEVVGEVYSGVHDGP